MKTKLLYVEDEADLGNVTQQYLEAMNFQVTWCTTGKQALQEYLANPSAYALVIIDIQLPDTDGFELARKIVAQNHNAIFLFLTARKEKKDRLHGLNIGAMDYITKPFDVDELVLRIRNITRRFQPADESNETETVIEVGDIILNLEALSLTIAGQPPTTLTLREAELLAHLFTHRNTIVKREDLLLRFWGENDYFMGRSLDVFISRLRKLLRHSTSGTTIDNVYGVGFILNIPITTPPDPR